MHRFHEDHPAFKGFSQFYHREIYPQLAAWEGKRKRTNFWSVPALILAALIAGTVIWLTFQSTRNSYVIGIITLGIMVLPAATYRHFYRDFQTMVKDFLVGKVCNYTGLQYSREAKDRPYIADLQHFNFFPRSYERLYYEDHMRGSSQGIHFDILEIHGEYGHKNLRQPHTATIFKFDLPDHPDEKVVVLRKGDRKPKFGKRVGFAAPPFSHLFEVYGQDQVMSRFLLHPVFLERILYMEDVIGGVNTRFALDNKTLWVVVETANRFEQGSMWTSFVNPKRTQLLIWEVSSALSIVDALVGLLRKPGSSV